MRGIFGVLFRRGDGEGMATIPGVLLDDAQNAALDEVGRCSPIPDLSCEGEGLLLRHLSCPFFSKGRVRYTAASDQDAKWTLVVYRGGGGGMSFLVALTSERERRCDSLSPSGAGVGRYRMFSRLCVSV